MSRNRVRSYALALLTCSIFLVPTFGCSNPGGITAPDSTFDNVVADDPNLESIPSPRSDRSDPEVMLSTYEDVNG